MSWIAVRVQLSITHKPLPQLVLADVPSDRKGPAKHSGWPRHHLLQVWCDGCDKNAFQSFRSIKVRKGQKRRKDPRIWVWISGCNQGCFLVLFFFFLLSFEGKDFLPTYSHDKAWLPRRVSLGWWGWSQVRFSPWWWGWSQILPLSIVWTTTHCVAVGMSLWAEFCLLGQPVAGPAVSTPLFYESEWFQETLVDDEPEMLQRLLNC